MIKFGNVEQSGRTNRLFVFVFFLIRVVRALSDLYIFDDIHYIQDFKLHFVIFKNFHEVKTFLMKRWNSVLIVHGVRWLYV